MEDARRLLNGRFIVFQASSCLIYEVFCLSVEVEAAEIIIRLWFSIYKQLSTRSTLIVGITLFTIKRELMFITLFQQLSLSEVGVERKFWWMNQENVLD